MIHIQTSAINPVQKLLAALLGAVIVIAGIMFSIVVIPIVVVIGVAYFYWKTRSLRNRPPGNVWGSRDIEGEATVVDDDHDETESSQDAHSLTDRR